MREKRNVAWGQSAPVVATAAALWIAGVVALPLIFGAQPIGVASGLVWLAVALAITVSLVALMPNLARVLAAGLARLSAALASPDAPSSATFKTPELLVVARLLVLAGELLVIQAILRRPIAIALGGERQVATVEAGIAAGALFLILPLLMWTYQTTRPMVQAATLRALDAAIPTIGTAELTEPATRGSHVVTPLTERRPTPVADDATAVSARAAARRRGPTRVADDATAVSPRDDDKAAATEVVGDATVVSPPGGDKTVVSPPGGDKTVVSPPSGDKTVVSPPGGDKTVISPRDGDETFVSPPRGDDPRARGT
jgi:hypothetical protein